MVLGSLLLGSAAHLQRSAPIVTPSRQPTGWVTVSLGNRQHWVLPLDAATTVGDVLAKVMPPLPTGGQLWLDGQLLATNTQTLSPNQPHILQLFPYSTVQLQINRDNQQLAQQSGTVGSVLAGCQCALFLGDSITPAWSEPLLNARSQITVQSAQPVTLRYADHTETLRTNQSTVGAFLAEQGIRLWGQDQSEPALTQPLPSDRQVTITTDQYPPLIERHDLPFEHLQQANPDWPLDQSGLIQAGRPGVQVTWRQQLAADQAPQLLASWLALAPKAQIFGYGTQIQIQSLATPDGVAEYWRVASFYATSYSPARSGVDASQRNYGRTRSGKLLTKGLVAVDPNIIPLGTRLYIPGYGFAEAADTGGGVRGKMIDLGYDDWNYQSWHQQVQVYFLTPVPAADQIRWILP